MLKIRDNVDLKELEKYGFYDNNWGSYIKNVEVREGRYSKNVNISVRKETKEIEMYVPFWSKYLDCLYDLIKDGLVIKVDD